MASVAVVAGPPGTTAAGPSPAAARLPRCHHAAKLDARQQSRSWGGLVSHGNVGATPGGLRSSSLRWGASLDFGSEIAPWLSSGPLRRGISSRNAAVVAAGNVERSYIMIKPDGVQRGLVGEVISRFERKGFTLRGLKLFQTPRDVAEEHYGELKERPFFPRLVEYITSGPVVAMVGMPAETIIRIWEVWEGPGAVASARKLIGVTNPLNAEPGTIRGDFGVNTGRNIIHGSDSPENGEREIALWFKDGEVLDWKPTIEPWILE